MILIYGGQKKLFIPGYENYTSMTPTEFEKYAIRMLEDATNGLENVNFEHNVFVDAHDGTYQIDGRITYRLFGCDFIVLVECKRYRASIKREKIQILCDKVKAAGAHKGIFVTTSNYQSGAIKYAADHGIALLNIIDGKLTYEVRAQGEKQEYMYPKDLPRFQSILQESISEGRTKFCVVDKTEYLKEYLTRENYN